MHTARQTRPPRPAAPSRRTSHDARSRFDRPAACRQARRPTNSVNGDIRVRVSRRSRCTRPPTIGPLVAPIRKRVGAFGDAVQPGRVVLQTLDGGDQDAGTGQHQLTQRRRPRAAPVTLEQRATKRPLDPLQLGGERRLGQAEQRRGLGDAAGLGDRADHPKVTQLDVHSTTVGAMSDGRKTPAVNIRPPDMLHPPRLSTVVTGSPHPHNRCAIGFVTSRPSRPRTDCVGRSSSRAGVGGNRPPVGVVGV